MGQRLCAEGTREWKGSICYNNGSSTSKGVAILIGEAAGVTWREAFSDNAGRVLVLDMVRKTWQGRLITIYAPNEEAERKVFLSNLEGWITPIGDFNVVQSPEDVRKTGKYRNDISRFALADLCCKNDMVDMWRAMNPGCRM